MTGGLKGEQTVVTRNFFRACRNTNNSIYTR